MFRRLPCSLPKDLDLATDLGQLGYFINDEDQIRMIENPEHKHHYKINRNDRINDVYRDALNRCVRAIIKERLTNLGLSTVRLPLGAKDDESHVPIYISKGIQGKKRIVVVFGERSQELGIFSYRSMADGGIRNGSAQEFVDAIMHEPSKTSTDDVPGIVIANPGQLIWYRGGGRAIGYNEYLNMPRQSAVSGPFRIDPVDNRVSKNATYTDHIRYIFDEVLNGLMHPEAKLDIIGLEYTGDAAIQYLAYHWHLWKLKINGICLGNPQFKAEEITVQTGSEEDFKDFLAKRVRAYFVSDEPVETPLPGRDKYGCNCYASGEEMYEDGILVKSWRSMLDWFNMISVLKDYEEPVFTMVENGVATT